MIGTHTVVDSPAELNQDTIGVPELLDGGTNRDTALLWLTVIGNHTVVDPSTELIQDIIGLVELLGSG